MREEDETYKEWLVYKEECSGEPTGVSTRKTTKKEKKEKKTAGIQSRDDQMENRVKEADSRCSGNRAQFGRIREFACSRAPPRAST